MVSPDQKEGKNYKNVTADYQNLNPSLSMTSSYEDLFGNLIASGYLLPSSIGGITPELLKMQLTSTFDPNLTEEEEEERKKLYIKNLVKDGCEYQGFDVDFEYASFELRVMDLRSIVKAPWEKNLDDYKSFVDFALKSAESNVRFDKIVKANWQVDNPVNYYITFEAYDPADDRTKIYQTRLVRRIPFDKSFADILREKPPPPPAPHCEDRST